MSKTMIGVAFLVLLISTSYQYGRYKGHRFEELTTCNEKIRQQVLTGNSSYIEHVSKVPFEVAYYYTLGRVYECAFRKDGSI